MEANTFIFGFSILIFSLGTIMFILMAREYTKMAEKDFIPSKETGPRAVLFNKLFKFFSEEQDDDDDEEAMKARLKKLLDEKD